MKVLGFASILRILAGLVPTSRSSHINLFFHCHVCLDSYNHAYYGYALDRLLTCPSFQAIKVGRDAFVSSYFYYGFQVAGTDGRTWQYYVHLLTSLVLVILILLISKSWRFLCSFTKTFTLRIQRTILARLTTALSKRFSKLSNITDSIYV